MIIMQSQSHSDLSDVFLFRFVSCVRICERRAVDSGSLRRSAKSSVSPYSKRGGDEDDDCDVNLGEYCFRWLYISVS
jgi:hypothetical protein